VITKGGHVPVLKEEILELFGSRYPGHFLDMTFGGGGHTRAILEGHPSNRVTSVDCDPEAKSRAEYLRDEFGRRFIFVDSFFDELEKTVSETAFTGILMDLGVSSFQLDTPTRGFSFRADAEADMRLNPRIGVPAWQFIEQSDLETLEKITRDYAEERNWRRIARALYDAKGSEEIRTTLGLAKLISNHVRAPRHIHPATRVFMGLRMAVNREVERLQAALPWAYNRLAEGGVLAVISFHSVEDREVKIFFKGVTTPKKTAPATLLIKRVGRPNFHEKTQNARARSAKLRALQKDHA